MSIEIIDRAADRQFEAVDDWIVAVSALNPAERKVVSAFVRAGLQRDTAARALGITPGAFSVTMLRIRRKVQKAWGG